MEKSFTITNERVFEAWAGRSRIAPTGWRTWHSISLVDQDGVEWHCVPDDKSRDAVLASFGKEVKTP